MTQDTAWLWLMRIGTKAFKFNARKEASLQWLLDRADRAIVFSERKERVWDGLAQHGQFTLRLVNARQKSFAYLNWRREIAQKLVIRRREVRFLYLG